MDDGFMTGYVAGQNEGGNGGGNGMWGGDGSWIFAFLIIALIFGNRLGLGGDNGNGGNGAMSFLPYAIGGSGALTRGDLCSEFSFNDLQNGVRGIANGICSLGYDQLAQINGVNSNIAAGFAGVNNAVCTLGYQNAQLINGLENVVQNGFNSSNIVALQNQNALQTQIAQCCCDQRAATADLKYTMATDTCALQQTMNTNTRDIIDSQNAGTRAILDYLCQEKIADLQAENQSLKLAASQERQNNYLVSQLRPFPVASYSVPNPFTGSYGYQGAGCGNYGCCGCGA